jgi:hypothetical protein
MKIKTQDLTGPALDWAVAKASGRLGAWRRDESRPGTSILDIDFDEHGELCEYVPGSRRDPYKPWRPSTDWSQGGPIIERERINLMFCAGFWRATKDDRPTSGERAEEDGPTVLIAAMRCFVASKLGDEIEIPEELTP